MTDVCGFFWGSHGCDWSPGHGGTVHRCGPVHDPCCDYDVAAHPEHRIRYWHGGFDPDETATEPPSDALYSEWRPYGDGFWYP